MKRIRFIISRLIKAIKLYKNILFKPTLQKIVIVDLLRTLYPILSDKVHLEAAIKWLCRSQDVTGSGGSSGGYSFSNGWAPPYPETTGYIIPTFLKYGVLTNNDEYMARAIKMGDWEIEVQHPSGAVRGQMGIQGKPVVFNTGQVILGWVALYKNTQQSRFLEAAIRAADWLVDIQNKNGTWTQHTFLNISHAYHSRVAWPLFEIYSVTKIEKYKVAATKNILNILSKVRGNDWIEEMAFLHNKNPLTHTIAYTLRGLLEASVYMNKEKEQEIIGLVEGAAEKIMLAYELRKVSPNAMPQYLSAVFDNQWQPQANYSCLTGNAQMAIIWLKLYQKNNDGRFLNAALKMIDQLKQKQNLVSTNEGIKGAIPGSNPIWGNYFKYYYPNWATKFFADAIMLQEEIMKKLEKT